MNLIEIVKTWINGYPSYKVLIGHKIVHFFGNGALAITLGYLHVNLWISLAILTATAVGKEVADHFKATPGKETPLPSHVIDVVLTVIGGICGLVVAAYCPDSMALTVLGISVALVIIGVVLAEQE